jgi:aldose 1-epimerase
MNRIKSFAAAGCIAAVLAALATPAGAATARREDGGTLKDGRQVPAVTLRARNGVTVRVLAYGATLQSLRAPDRKGRLADIVLGHDTAAEYEASQDFFGVTVGRFANRIAGGRFTLDGVTYQLPRNNGANSLHGGGKGFDRVLWEVGPVSSGKQAAVTFTHVSPDGDSGYPGRLAVSVTYALDDAGALTITFAAETDRPTIVSLTNHALFNLAGDCTPGGAMNQRLTIPASRYTPVDEGLIPTGAMAQVAGTPFDFRAAKPIARGLRDGTDPQVRIGRGFDHNWVLDKGRTALPGLVARAEDPGSGRRIEMLSTEPGVQFYSGNFLDGTIRGKHGCVYRMGDGFALEPQRFPDTPNRPEFGSARLDPGKPYRHVMVIRPSAR